MIFMSQTGLTDLTRERELDQWYVEHLRIMLTVPGVTSAQRFKTDTPGHSPSLAMYTVASADVFRDPYYLSVRGMGEWLALVPKQHYHRNLFDGMETAPDVVEGHVLLVVDRARPGPGPQGITLTWLKAAGIDCSTPYRGIAVVRHATAEALAADGETGVYRPVTSRAAPA